MRRFNNILVAHDFSANSSQALKDGIELAVAWRASLHLLYVEVIHADSPLKGEEETTKASRMKAMLHEAIEESVRELGWEMSDIPSIVYSVMRDFAAAPSILNYSNDYGVDLIVMGTHGRRGLSRKLIGSVAEEVVRLAPCQVLTIRENVQKASLASSVHSVLVPVDFSVHAREAVAVAKQIADFFDARLDLVHVVEESLHPAFYTTGVFSIYDLNPELDATVTTELKKLYTSLPGPDGEVRYLVRRGNPVKEILEAAEEGHDLIVIATHGLSGLDRAIMGSVTERIVRRASTPVLTVKARAEDEKKAPSGRKEAATV